MRCGNYLAKNYIDRWIHHCINHEQMIKCNKCSVLLKDEWLKLHDEVNCDKELFFKLFVEKTIESGQNMVPKLNSYPQKNDYKKVLFKHVMFIR